RHAPAIVSTPPDGGGPLAAAAEGCIQAPTRRVAHHREVGIEAAAIGGPRDYYPAAAVDRHGVAIVTRADGCGDLAAATERRVETPWRGPRTAPNQQRGQTRYAQSHPARNLRPCHRHALHAVRDQPTSPGWMKRIPRRMGYYSALWCSLGSHRSVALVGARCHAGSRRLLPERPRHVRCVRDEGGPVPSSFSSPISTGCPYTSASANSPWTPCAGAASSSWTRTPSSG